MDKLDGLNSSNYIRIAAEYYIMAFRDGEIPHFEDKSFSKKMYLFLTSLYYMTFIKLISWLYLLMSFWEPGNSHDFSRSINDPIFLALFYIEIFI